MVIIVMGVSGSGKTLIGKRLSEKLGLPFYDADNFHPAANIAKMHGGQPLNDRDRVPWLDNLAAHINKWEQENGAVLACSALKQKYRDRLCSVPADIRLVYLKGPKELIAGRLARRTGHFFDPSLLDSQFDTLEEPKDALTISIDKEPDDIIDELLMDLN